MAWQSAAIRCEERNWMAAEKCGRGRVADQTRSPASPPNNPCHVALNRLTMRVFLRSRQTRLYCASSNRWAGAVAQALLFRSVRQAARFAFDEKVPEAEIVMRSDLMEQEITLPLLPEWCDLPEPGSAAD